MNFDELQQQWQNEEVSVPEVSLAQQNKINNPLSRIKKNMKMEFWMNVLTFIPALLFIFLFIDNPKGKLYTFMIVFAMIIVTVFYFNIFYKTYLFLSENKTINTKDSLKDLLFKLKLNEQYYISYYLAFVPFLVCEMIIIYEFFPIFKVIHVFSAALIFVFMTIFGLFLLYFFGKHWFYEMYGKHINKITVLISEISGNEQEHNFGSTIFKVKKQFQIFIKTEQFFTNRLGKFGGIINKLFWGIVLFFLLIVLSYFVGYTIGVLSVKINELTRSALSNEIYF